MILLNYSPGLTQIRLENAICSGEWHLLSLDVVPVRKSCKKRKLIDNEVAIAY